MDIVIFILLLWVSEERNDTYVQSWLKLTKKTPLGGSAVWFVRFMRPDMPYFNPCVNTSTLRARFCINRTYGARTIAPLRLLTLLDSLFCLPHAFALSSSRFLSFPLLSSFLPSFTLTLNSLLLSLTQTHTHAHVYIIGTNDQVVRLRTIPTSDCTPYSILNSWRSQLNLWDKETTESLFHVPYVPCYHSNTYARLIISCRRPGFESLSNFFNCKCYFYYLLFNFIQ